MAQQTIFVENGVPVMQLTEVVIGSKLELAVKLERLVSEDPEVFEPFDFSGMEIEAHIKDKPTKDVDPDAEFVCTMRTPGDGWIDLFLGGDVTGLLLAKEYHASLKVWPIGSPALGDTLLAFILPLVFKATR
jgi:hypothetical protein